jgi:predicted membrane protein
METIENSQHPGQGGWDTRLLLGLLLIAVGGVLIAENLNLLSYEMSHVLISLPMLLVVLGLFNIARKSYTPGYILVAIGLFFLTPRILDVPEDFYRNFWPAVLIIIGILFIVQKTRTHTVHPQAHQWRENIVSETDRSDYINETAILGGRNYTLISDHFIGGKISSVLGGSKINLLNCTPSPGCTLDVEIILGGTKLIVPEDWNIKMETTSILGGFEDKRLNSSIGKVDPSKTMIIKGTCILGGGEITSLF